MPDESLLKRFEEDPELQKAIDFILQAVPDKFEEVKQVKYAVFFSKKESPVHFAGMCRKLSDVVRYKTGLDFIIIIYKDNFLRSTKNDQLKILIHELHHITLDKKGKPKTRRHNELEDFCELPSHDKYSDSILASLIQDYIVKQRKQRAVGHLSDAESGIR